MGTQDVCSFLPMTNGAKNNVFVPTCLLSYVIISLGLISISELVGSGGMHM